jgi:RNA polymerase sigma factor (sigma-70 family)
VSILNPEAGGSERPRPGEIWRTWLVTGARAHPIDRRRLQGEHRGLKQILAEGGEAEVMARPWRDFSRAMVRQSVNEAMVRLTARERVVLTMAYFAGFSNEEIAQELGMTVRGVQRSLRRALDRLSAALERGRRIALGVVALVGAGRFGQWLRDALTAGDTQVLAAVVVATVVAVAPPAAPVTHHGSTGTAVVTHSDQTVAAPPPAAAAAQPAPGTAATAAPSVAAPAAPAVSAPVISVPPLPPVTVPKLPNLPAKPSL